MRVPSWARMVSGFEKKALYMRLEESTKSVRLLSKLQSYVQPMTVLPFGSTEDARAFACFLHSAPGERGPGPLPQL